MPFAARRLGEILVRDYHVLDADVREAIEAQNQGQPDRIGQFLVRRGILTDRDLATALGQQLRIPVMIGLPRLRVTEEVLKLVPVACAEKKLVIPVALTGIGPEQRLVLAMADPTDVSVLAALEGFTGIAIQASIATEEDIRRAFKVFYLGEIGHADPAELTDSFEVMRTRLRTGSASSLELFDLSSRAKSQHSGELVKPKPLAIGASGGNRAKRACRRENDVPIGDRDPIPMSEESLEIPFESTRASVPQDPDHASSTIGA